MQRSVNIEAEAHKLIEAMSGLCPSEQQKTQSRSYAGQSALRRAGTGEEFWQFRHYRAGDAPHDIDWRQSAKADSDIFVRERQHQNQKKIRIILPLTESLNYGSKDAIFNKSDTCRILGKSLELLHNNQGDRIIQSGTADIYYIIGDFLDDDILAEIKNARAPNCIQILDPDEIDFPFKGRVQFHDNHDGEVIELNHAGAARETYKQRLSAYCEDIKAACIKARGRYHRHNSAHSLAPLLYNLWMEENA